MSCPIYSTVNKFAINLMILIKASESDLENIEFRYLLFLKNLKIPPCLTQTKFICNIIFLRIYFSVNVIIKTPIDIIEALKFKIKHFSNFLMISGQISRY